MKAVSQSQEPSAGVAPRDDDPLASLLRHRSATGAAAAASADIMVGELIGIAGDGHTPLVVYPGRPGSAAVAARSVIDLHGAHVGRSVVLAVDPVDRGRAIVLGVVRAPEAWPLAETPGQVEVDVDGERLTISAREALVLRCGKASITLTKAGKVLVHGTYVSTRSSGVNRIKGGSVHIN
jgi:hypothetical protein